LADPSSRQERPSAPKSNISANELFAPESGFDGGQRVTLNTRFINVARAQAKRIAYRIGIGQGTDKQDSRGRSKPANTRRHFDSIEVSEADVQKNQFRLFLRLLDGFPARSLNPTNASSRVAKPLAPTKSEDGSEGFDAVFWASVRQKEFSDQISCLLCGECRHVRQFLVDLQAIYIP
jgi:hypothetical protein